MTLPEQLKNYYEEICGCPALIGMQMMLDAYDFRKQMDELIACECRDRTVILRACKMLDTITNNLAHYFETNYPEIFGPNAPPKAVLDLRGKDLSETMPHHLLQAVNELRLALREEKSRLK